MSYTCCLRKENRNFLLILLTLTELTKLLYLSCIFEKTNDLNLSLQANHLTPNSE